MSLSLKRASDVSPLDLILGSLDLIVLQRRGKEGGEVRLTIPVLEAALV